MAKPPDSSDQGEKGGRKFALIINVLDQPEAEHRPGNLPNRAAGVSYRANLHKELQIRYRRDALLFYSTRRWIDSTAS